MDYEGGYEGGGSNWLPPPEKKLTSNNPALLGLREGFIDCWQKQYFGIIYMTGIRITQVILENAMMGFMFSDAAVLSTVKDILMTVFWNIRSSD